eukprot:6200851-Pleurochrysis_carterae.AAC.1
MGVEDLRDQLEKHKLLGKTGFTLTLPNRTAYLLQLQMLLLEANKDANDLEDGESGIDGRSLRRRATVRGRKRWIADPKMAFSEGGHLNNNRAG